LTRDSRRRNAIVAAGHLPLTARLAHVRGSAEEICDVLASMLRKTASRRCPSTVIHVGSEMSPGRQADGLRLQVLLEALDSVLSAEAALLVAPERRVGAEPLPAVHGHGPRA